MFTRSCHRASVRGALTVLLFILAGPMLLQVPAARSGSQKPSIVLVLTDDQRWDSLWAMPQVRHLLGLHGVTFTHAYVPNPLCCPSRTSILTGEYSHSTGVYWNAPPHGGFPSFNDSSTLATWLSAAGYRT